jgi:DNA-directed RNA polymerase subunit RPC12/RpoP
MSKKKVNVRKHKRKLPSGKEVWVKSHNREIDNPKIEESKKDDIENGDSKDLIDKEKYKCYYCDSKTSLKEVSSVERQLKNMDGEDQEFIYDELPNSSKPRKKPYTHLSDLGYQTLNICRGCFNQANTSQFRDNQKIEEWEDNKWVLDEIILREFRYLDEDDLNLLIDLDELDKFHSEVSREEFKQRANILETVGFIEKKGKGKFSLTEIGKKYIKNNL